MRTENRLTTFTTTDGKVITTRSALEARWLIFFDRIGLNAQYEPIVFDVYTPDFFIEGLGYIEIKPTLQLLTTESAQRIERTAREYPANKYYAFISNRVGFELNAMWQGNQLFAVPGKLMFEIIRKVVNSTSSLASLSNIAAFMQIAIDHANAVKLDHFVSVAKITELHRILA